jgi:hypothetical protein
MGDLCRFAPLLPQFPFGLAFGGRFLRGVFVTIAGLAALL